MIDKVLMTLGVMILVFLWGYMRIREKGELVTLVDKALQRAALQRASEAEEEEEVKE